VFLTGAALAAGLGLAAWRLIRLQNQALPEEQAAQRAAASR
jgi:hypothetical protein